MHPLPSSPPEQYMSSFPHLVGHVTGHSFPSFPTGPDMDTNDQKDQNMRTLF